MKHLMNVLLTSTLLSTLVGNVHAQERRPTPVKLDRAAQIKPEKETTVSDLARAVTPGNLLTTPAKVEVHRGGNGGEDLELTLKKTALQIAHFVKSTMGSKVFHMVNPDSLINTTNTMDVDVVSEPVMDKYGSIRTCVNEPERNLITCNSLKISELIRQQKNDVLTAIMFHEILGLMGVELGYQDNVSVYPISSKILPYHNVVASTPITEAQIRPEYYGLDNRSYGVTLKNKSTGETLRVICLNDNVEVHRCRNYTIVRNANKMQAPLVAEIVSINPTQLKSLPLHTFDQAEFARLSSRLKTLQDNGVKYLIGSKSYSCNEGGEYRFGLGIVQRASKSMQEGQDCSGNEYVKGILLGATVGLYGYVDLGAEVVKQGLNFTTYPIKVVVKGIKTLKTKRQLKKLNKKIALAALVTNPDGDLSLVGKTKSVSDADYKAISYLLSVAIQTIK